MAKALAVVTVLAGCVQQMATEPPQPCPLGTYQDPQVSQQSCLLDEAVAISTVSGHWQCTAGADSAHGSYQLVQGSGITSGTVTYVFQTIRKMMTYQEGSSSDTMSILDNGTEVERWTHIVPDDPTSPQHFTAIDIVNGGQFNLSCLLSLGSL